MSSFPLKSVLKTVDSDGNAVELAIVPPSSEAKRKAQLHRGKVFGEALDARMKTRVEIEDVLRSRNLWDDERQARHNKLREAILDGELRLKKGGNAGLTKKKAREVAIQMGKDRAALRNLRSIFGTFEAETADAYADQAHFNALVAFCTVYNDGPKEGRHYFASIDDYVERATEAAAYAAATKLNEVMYGPNDEMDVVRKLPENEFLIKYGFVDNDLNYIDEKGHRVDEKGRQIDEDGYFLDKDGCRVDERGNKVGADGNYDVEFAEFLDD